MGLPTTKSEVFLRSVYHSVISLTVVFALASPLNAQPPSASDAPFIWLANLTDDEIERAKIRMLLPRLLTPAAGPERRLCIELWQADFHAPASDPVTLERCRNALKIHETLANPPLDAGEIVARIGAWHYNRDDYMQAERDYRQARFLAQKEKIFAQRSLHDNDRIDKQYGGRSFIVETLRADEIKALRDVVVKFQPDVLHFQSSFGVFPHSGQIYLESEEPEN